MTEKCPDCESLRSEVVNLRERVLVLERCVPAVKDTPAQRRPRVIHDAARKAGA